MRQVHEAGTVGPRSAGGTLVTVGDRFFGTVLAGRAGEGLEGSARAAMAHVLGLARECGATAADVVRARLSHTGPGGDPGLRAAHAAAFGSDAPAGSAIRVSWLPEEASIAVEVEGVRGGGRRIRRQRADDGAGTAVAIELDGEVWVSGITGSAGARSASIDQEPAGQIRRAFGRTEAVLEALGLPVADVVATRHFLRPELQGRPRPAEWVDFMRRAVPTAAGIAVEGLEPPDAAFMIEVDAVRGAATQRKNLRTGRTYEVEHHYCRAVRVGQRDVVYVAGTTSIVPGEVVQHPGQVGPQVGDTLAIIRWAIQQQGLAWTELARTRTYVVGGPGALREAAEALRAGLTGVPAVSTLVGVPVLGRPAVVVEIEATAVRG